MKKAFTLFELIISLIIFSILITILFKPMINLNNQYINTKEKSFDFYDINQAIMLIDKLLKDGIDFKVIDNNIKFFLIDYNSILIKNEQNLSIALSPFIYKDDNYKILTYSKDIMDDYKYLNKKYIDVYSFELKKISKIQINKNNDIYFLNEKFKGNFLPILAKILIYKNNNNLYIKYCYNLKECKESILIKDIDIFDVELFEKYFLFYICKNSNCIKKRINL